VLAPRPRRVVALLAGLVVALGACGDDDPEPASAAATAATAAPESSAAEPSADAPAATAETLDTTVDGAAGTTADGEQPSTEATTAATSGASDDESADEDLRIVSLSPTHTEMLFAIGAGDLLVAVDDQSDHPEAALDLPNDLSSFEPNVEAIAVHEPDLVLTGGDFTGVGDQLASIGIDSWDGPASTTFGDTYDQILELGELTGHDAEAAALVEQMQADIDEIVAGTDAPGDAVEYYHEIDPTLYSVTSNTFLGEVYSLFGLRSVADRVETDAGPYPQLSAELLVSADPDVIFVDDCCGETPESVAGRPGWDAITAVREGQVFQVDDDLASRWGPRLVDYVALVAAAVETLP
jgi:iron complex transport system substrate-binding protein